MVTTATAPRLRPPRGAVALAMNSVSLVTTRMGLAELAEARRHAEENGGLVRVVPSAEPRAPGPFEYRRGAEMAEAAYRRTHQWLSSGAPELHGAPG